MWYSVVVVFQYAYVHVSIYTYIHRVYTVEEGYHTCVCMGVQQKSTMYAHTYTGWSTAEYKYVKYMYFSPQLFGPTIKVCIINREKAC